MNRSVFVRPDPSLHGESTPIDKATFSQLYDRYAPTLFGVIRAIVQDEIEAVRLLEITFNEIRLQYPKPRSTTQPLFVWLLSVARSVALSAANAPQRVPQLTNAGRVGVSMATSANIGISAARAPGLSVTSELLNAVLFRNCTPEEVVLATDLPVTTARQQLRRAMQQLRASGTS